jgi:hypothetical protein
LLLDWSEMNIRLISEGCDAAIQNLEAIQIKEKSINLIFNEEYMVTIDLPTPSQLVVVIEE